MYFRTEPGALKKTDLCGPPSSEHVHGDVVAAQRRAESLKGITKYCPSSLFAGASLNRSTRLSKPRPPGNSAGPPPISRHHGNLWRFPQFEKEPEDTADIFCEKPLKLVGTNTFTG